MLNFIFVSTWAQNVQARVAEVQFNTLSKEGVDLSGMFGEGIVGSESKEEIVIVHSFYSGVVTDSITSVIRVESITGLKAFPNPTRDGLILKSESRQHSAYQVSLMSETGTMLHPVIWPLDKSLMTLELGQMPAAMYHISMRDVTSGQQSSMKIIKQ